MGLYARFTKGYIEGNRLGCMVGRSLDIALGCTVACRLGCLEGTEFGCMLGLHEGCIEGNRLYSWLEAWLCGRYRIRLYARFTRRLY